MNASNRSHALLAVDLQLHVAPLQERRADGVRPRARAAEIIDLSIACGTGVRQAIVRS